MGAATRALLALCVLFLGGMAARPPVTGPTPTPPVPTPVPTATPAQPTMELVGPGNAESALVAFIAGARQRVLVEAFALTDAPVAAALEAAARRGVDVRVMLDPRGLNSGEAMSLLAGVGIRTHAPNPAYLTHMDVVVIDAGAVAVLTSPLLTETLGPSGHGYMVIDRDRYDVLQAASLFYDDWLRRPVHLFGHNLIVLPDSAGTLASLIGQAGLRIELYTPGLTDSRVLSALQDARGRGVIVRVLTLSGANNASLRSLAQPRNVHFGNEGGGTVLVIDRRFIVLGSMDLSTGTLRGNRELGVVIGGPQVVAIVDAAFFDAWNRGTVLQPAPPPLSVSVLPGIRVGRAASLQVSTAPDAQITMTIIYPPGSKGLFATTLVNAHADSQGLFIYRWIVPTTVKPGRATLRLAARSEGVSTTATTGFTVSR